MLADLLLLLLDHLPLLLHHSVVLLVDELESLLLASIQFILSFHPVFGSGFLFYY